MSGVLDRHIPGEMAVRPQDIVCPVPHLPLLTYHTPLPAILTPGALPRKEVHQNIFQSRLHQICRNLLVLIRLLCICKISIKIPHHQQFGTPGHGWDLPVFHYHEIMLIYPYPFLVAITQLFSWIIFINDCICILTGSPE